MVWRGCISENFIRASLTKESFTLQSRGLLTVKEWNHLKTVITQVDEVLDCTMIMFEEVKEERMEMNCVTDCDEMQEEEQKKPNFERKIEEATDSLETFNEEVVKEIVRLCEDTCKYKNIRLLHPEDFESNANFAFESQN